MPKPVKLQKPEKVTLRDKVKEYILERIYNGSYEPGSRIVETKLAHELGISQAPVREAIIALSMIGFLEERPYSGAYVRRITPEWIEDLFETRAFIERRIAFLATINATRIRHRQTAGYPHPHEIQRRL